MKREILINKFYLKKTQCFKEILIRKNTKFKSKHEHKKHILKLINIQNKVLKSQLCVLRYRRKIQVKIHLKTPQEKVAYSCTQHEVYKKISQKNFTAKNTKLFFLFYCPRLPHYCTIFVNNLKNRQNKKKGGKKFCLSKRRAYLREAKNNNEF